MTCLLERLGRKNIVLEKPKNRRIFFALFSRGMMDL
jgi:hypothetical protein